MYPQGQFGDDSFAAEVRSTIVSEDTALYNQNVYTILAGYTDDMKHLMDGNAGLASRFATIIDFPDYTIDECFQILNRHLQKKKFSLDTNQQDDIEQQLRTIITDMKHEQGSKFGNARAMVTLGEKIRTNSLMRGDTPGIITFDDLPHLHE